MDYTIKSLVKSLEIIEALAESPSTAKALTVSLGMNKSTLHRFLFTLDKQNYIEQTESGEYCLTQKFIQLGLSAQSHLKLSILAKPYLAQLSEEVGESSLIACFHHDEVFYMDKVESPQALRIVMDVGKRVPCYCVASGKVFLAHMSREQLQDYLNRTPLQARTGNTMVNPSRLKQDLEQVIRQGYALDNEEFEPGLRGVAAPIYDYTGKVIAALCVSGVSSRLDEVRVDMISETLLHMSKSISKKMGYQASSAIG
ncbi:IclR family transcriptional regulator [Ammoniphilus sp. 3BR4]|uniref:IclR family transcriptional regulator n=1 Tax=Ammoniphilus sp. 3BR4 TaxID=3158265 RepID=UPI003466E11C